MSSKYSWAFYGWKGFKGFGNSCWHHNREMTLGYVKATWLILPVVIRSSQRLSHACLSINILLWNCERLITTVIVPLIIPYYLDTRSNSRANTCIKTRLLAEGLHLFDRDQLTSVMIWWFIISLRFACLCRLWIIQVSALSALYGRVLAYHGFNG